MGKRVNIADKETLDKVYNALVPDEIYGFIEHMDILAPGQRIEYTGANKDYTPITVNKETGQASYNSWARFPWLLANKPYMVHSDGTADYRLNETNYAQKEDGSASDVANAAYDGGAFAWAMKIYKQEYTIGSDRVVNFSISKRDGFEPIGFIDPSNKELEGVWIPMFYGSILGAESTPKMTSLATFQPTYNNTTDQQKTAITNFSSRAAFFGGAIVETLIDLMILFSKTTDLQGAYGNGNCHGHDASQAPTYGVKPNAVIGGGQFYGTSDGKSLNKIFHSIVLGSYNQWMRDPYVVCVNGKVKVSKNYNYDLTGAVYEDAGITHGKINDNAAYGPVYAHSFRTIGGFGALPAAPYKGSTALGGCDGMWVNTGITAVALRFGRCNYGLSDGPRALTLINPAAYAHWSFGAAILLLPPVGVAA